MSRAPEIYPFVQVARNIKIFKCLNIVSSLISLTVASIFIYLGSTGSSFPYGWASPFLITVGTISIVTTLLSLCIISILAGALQKQMMRLGRETSNLSPIETLVQGMMRQGGAGPLGAIPQLAGTIPQLATVDISDFQQVVDREDRKRVLDSMPTTSAIPSAPAAPTTLTTASTTTISAAPATAPKTRAKTSSRSNIRTLRDLN